MMSGEQQETRWWFRNTELETVRPIPSTSLSLSPLCFWHNHNENIMKRCWRSAKIKWATLCVCQKRKSWPTSPFPSLEMTCCNRHVTRCRWQIIFNNVLFFVSMSSLNPGERTDEEVLISFKNHSLSFSRQKEKDKKKKLKTSTSLVHLRLQAEAAGWSDSKIGPTSLLWWFHVSRTCYSCMIVSLFKND